MPKKKSATSHHRAAASRTAAARAVPRDLQVIYTKLFPADIEELKRRSSDTGIPWQTQLRAIVHEAITGPKMRAFKHLIPAGRAREISPGLTADDCLAVACAKSPEEALAVIKRVFTESGQDTRWLGVSDVIEIPLDAPALLGASIH